MILNYFKHPETCVNIDFSAEQVENECGCIWTKELCDECEEDYNRYNNIDNELEVTLP